MATLGLTWGQFGIGTNVYSRLRKLELPARQRNTIVHDVPLSTTKPIKDLGVQHFAVELEVEVGGGGTDIDTLIADVETDSARQLHFIHNGREVYYKVRAGSVTGTRTVNPYGGTVSTDRTQTVTLRFPVTDTQLYKAGDDSVIL